MTKRHSLSPFLRNLIRLSLAIILIAGCAPNDTTSTSTLPTPTQSGTQTAGDPTSPASNTDYLAQVTFEVDTPVKTPTGQSIYIEILDEVTGLALNPSRYRMEAKGTNHFTFKIPVMLGSLIKYRYGREGNPPIVEYTATGNQVRYRLAQVQGPMVVKDIIGGWKDQTYDGKSGRVTGQVVDATTNAPLPNIMISAGGLQTYTGSDGTYLIEGLPVGVHNVVAYSLDGAYKPYSQGAQVSADMNTPAPIRLAPANLVNVTFITRAPSDSAKGIPIRLLGNTLALGNTFADLGGGVSTVASRAPLMTLQADGRYSLTLALPSGLDLRYKYSAGDGFWNAEHNKDGTFKVRQLIVPNSDVKIEDTIETWQIKGATPITFTVTVPANTPEGDTVSIQFNPYGWTEPIPMWPLGNRQWLFVLYSPLQLASSIGYRFCRNDQCGIADDLATMGMDTTGKVFSPANVPPNIQDEVKQWAWIQTSTTPTTVVAPEVQPRGSSFMAGFELKSQNRPSWQPYASSGFDQIQQTGANWVIIDPTWTATLVNPPVIEPVSGKDPFWQDLVQNIVWAQDKNLNIAIYPNLSFETGADAWWSAGKRDATWWQSWFDRYHTFVINYADLATQVHAGLLILGDPGTGPSLSGGKLPSGAASNAPADADKRWRSLIADVRTHYNGKIAWALPYSTGMKDIPAFITDVDEVYLLWSASLGVPATATTNEMASAMGKLLDQDVSKLKEKLNKPFILGIDYPSINGAASQGCGQVGTQCLPFNSLNVETIRTKITPNLSVQAMLYNAALIAVSQRKWLDGFISRQYYLPAASQDFTSSVHGKPAADVIWYWYPKLLANPK